jgi:hypothetical protein
MLIRITTTEKEKYRKKKVKYYRVGHSRLR